MYLVVDLNSDWKKKMNYKELKELLISSIQEDLMMNIGEYDIVKDCSNELVKMAKEDYTSLKWITDLLESYSYKVIDLLEIQKDLEDLKKFFAPNDDTPLAISFKDVIDEINKGE